MKTILVAGAGHGGLTAAYNLAKAGYRVTVFERGEKHAIGYDWDDCMSPQTFDFAGFDRPPAEITRPFLQMSYYNPKKTVKLITPFEQTDTSTIFVDRVGLLSYLTDCCENAGVEFRFGTVVKRAICDNTGVVGLEIETEKGTESVYGDLVIDAAGVDSPVRKNLPSGFGVPNEIPETDMFHALRVYYNKTADESTTPAYTVFFYHCGKPGMDWAITEEDHIDVLIGKFGVLTQDEIDTALEDLHRDYPYMGYEILRGGYQGKIPLSRTLPKFVCNGYAAVGDSAGMTVPLNGCGLDLSIKAGKLLALTVMAAKDSALTTDKLWRYQYRYCTLFGNDLVIIAKMRKLLSVISADNVDFFLEQEILTEKELEMQGGNLSGVTLGYVLKKVIKLLPQAYLLPEALRALKGIHNLPFITKRMPPQYDAEKVRKWIELYNRT